MQPRMNRKDQAEATALLSGWARKKRGMIPKGYRLIFWIDTVPVEPNQVVEIRVVDKTNGKKLPTGKQSSARKRRPSDLEKAKKLSLEELGLGSRLINFLHKKKINSVGALLKWVTSTDEASLLKISGFGKNFLNQCKARLKAWKLIE